MLHGSFNVILQCVLHVHSAVEDIYFYFSGGGYHTPSLAPLSKNPGSDPDSYMSQLTSTADDEVDKTPNIKKWQ